MSQNKKNIRKGLANLKKKALKKVTKKVKRAAKGIVKREVPIISLPQRPKRNRLPRKNPVAAGVADDKALSAAFVNSQFDPFNSPPARYPNLNMMPTAVVSTKFRMNMSIVTDSTNSNTYAGAYLIPRLKETGKILTASANDVFTWGSPTDNPFLALATTQASRVRINALAIRVLNLAPLLDRGGSVWLGNLVNADSSDTSYTFVAPGTKTAVTNNQSLKFFDLADGQIEKKSTVVWEPIDETARFFRSENTTSGEDQIDAGMMTAPFIFCNVPNATTQNLVLEIAMHIEYVPLPGYATFVDAKVAQGDPNMVANLTAGLLGTEGLGSPAVTTGYPTRSRAIVNMASGLFGQLKSLAKTGYGAYKTVAGIYSMISTGGLLSNEDQAKHMLFASNFIALRDKWIKNECAASYDESLLRPRWRDIIHKIEYYTPSPYHMMKDRVVTRSVRHKYVAPDDIWAECIEDLRHRVSDRNQAYTPELKEFESIEDTKSIEQQSALPECDSSCFKMMFVKYKYEHLGILIDVLKAKMFKNEFGTNFQGLYLGTFPLCYCSIPRRNYQLEYWSIADLRKPWARNKELCKKSDKNRFPVHFPVNADFLQLFSTGIYLWAGLSSEGQTVLDYSPECDPMHERSYGYRVDNDPVSDNLCVQCNNNLNEQYEPEFFEIDLTETKSPLEEILYNMHTHKCAKNKKGAHSRATSFVAVEQEEGMTIYSCNNCYRFSAIKFTDRPNYILVKSSCISRLSKKGELIVPKLYRGNEKYKFA